VIVVAMTGPPGNYNCPSNAPGVTHHRGIDLKLKRGNTSYQASGKKRKARDLNPWLSGRKWN